MGRVCVTGTGGQELNFKNAFKKIYGVVVHTCNPRAGAVEMGSSLGLSAQPVESTCELQESEVPHLILAKWGAPKEPPRLSSMLHTQVCTCMHMREHPTKKNQSLSYMSFVKVCCCCC